ncbi:hypothetical protein [Duganella sp. BuS-21]|uniref:hypothetical protein n=1 Tax=Duganella sp. BuS-21 TaxID=2943848 RepID=UPI0035A5E6E4
MIALIFATSVGSALNFTEITADTVRAISPARKLSQVQKVAAPTADGKLTVAQFCRARGAEPRRRPGADRRCSVSLQDMLMTWPRERLAKDLAQQAKENAALPSSTRSTSPIRTHSRNWGFSESATT